MELCFRDVFAGPINCECQNPSLYSENRRVKSLHYGSDACSAFSKSSHVTVSGSRNVLKKCFSDEEEEQQPISHNVGSDSDTGATTPTRTDSIVQADRHVDPHLQGQIMAGVLPIAGEVAEQHLYYRTNRLFRQQHNTCTLQLQPGTETDDPWPKLVDCWPDLPLAHDIKIVTVDLSVYQAHSSRRADKVWILEVSQDRGHLCRYEVAILIEVQIAYRHQWITVESKAAHSMWRTQLRRVCGEAISSRMQHAAELFVTRNQFFAPPDAYVTLRDGDFIQCQYHSGDYVGARRARLLIDDEVSETESSEIQYRPTTRAGTCVSSGQVHEGLAIVAVYRTLRPGSLFRKMVAFHAVPWDTENQVRRRALQIWTDFSYDDTIIHRVHPSILSTQEHGNYDAVYLLASRHEMAEGMELVLTAVTAANSDMSTEYAAHWCPTNLRVQVMRRILHVSSFCSRADIQCFHQHNNDPWTGEEVRRTTNGDYHKLIYDDVHLHKERSPFNRTRRPYREAIYFVGGVCCYFTIVCIIIVALHKEKTQVATKIGKHRFFHRKHRVRRLAEWKGFAFLCALSCLHAEALPCYNQAFSQVQVAKFENTQSDAISLMQHTPTELDITPSVSYLVAHTFHISTDYRLAQLEVDSSQTMIQQLTPIWKPPGSELIVAIHDVADPPHDLQTSADATLLIEISNDALRKAHTDDCLILADVQLSDPHGRARGIKLRRVLWSRAAMTRSQVLQLFSAGWICTDVAISCSLWKNKIYWPDTDTAVRHFANGDFVHILIRSLHTASVHEVYHNLCQQEQADTMRYIYSRSPSPGFENNTPGTADQGILENREGDSSRPSRSRSRSLSLIQTLLEVRRAPERGDIADLTTTNLPCYQEESFPDSVCPHVFDRWCDRQNLDIPSSFGRQCGIQVRYSSPVGYRTPEHSEVEGLYEHLTIVQTPVPAFQVQGLRPPRVQCVDHTAIYFDLVRAGYDGQGPLQLDTYGLLEYAIGQRIVTVQNFDHQNVERAVREAWREYAAQFDLRIHLVRPQPEGPRTSTYKAVFIVEVMDYFRLRQEHQVPVLIDQCLQHENQVGVITTRAAAYILYATPVEYAYQAVRVGNSCAPRGLRPCQLLWRTQRWQPPQVFHPRMGDYVLIITGTITHYFADSGTIFHQARRFALETQRFAVEGVTVPRSITLQVHAISDSNRPLGYRALMLNIQDLTQPHSIWQRAVELWQDAGAYSSSKLVNVMPQPAHNTAYVTTVHAILVIQPMPGLLPTLHRCWVRYNLQRAEHLTYVAVLCSSPTTEIGVLRCTGLEVLVERYRMDPVIYQDRNWIGTANYEFQAGAFFEISLATSSIANFIYTAWEALEAEQATTDEDSESGLDGFFLLQLHARKYQNPGKADRVETGFRGAKYTINQSLCVLGRLLPPGNGHSDSTVHWFASRLDMMDDVIHWQGSSVVVDYMPAGTTVSIRLPQLDDLYEQLYTAELPAISQSDLTMLAIDMPEDLRLPYLQWLGNETLVGYCYEYVDIYTDGSYSRQSDSGQQQQATWALVVTATRDNDTAIIHAATGFVNTDCEDEYWTGASKQGSREAEIEAILQGVIWCVNGGCRVQVTINFDATTAGWPAAGEWNIASDNVQLRTTRAVWQLYDDTHPHSLRAKHVKAHTGQLGNEVANMLANHSRTSQKVTGPPRIAFKPYISGDKAPIEWLWMHSPMHSEDRKGLPEIHQGLLLSNAPAQLQDTSSAMLPSEITQSTEAPSATIRVGIVTYNVCSLKQDGSNEKLIVTTRISTTPTARRECAHRMPARNTSKK